MAVSIIDRKAASALMNVQQANEIIKQVATKSVALSMMRRLRNMSAGQSKLIILDALPHAYFVNGDTGRKQTTKMEWKNKFITAEEIAVILPFPESVIADSAFNIENEAIPAITEAFAAKIDAAIFNGTDAPASWPMGLLPLTKNQGNTVALAAGDIDDQDLYKKIMGLDGLFNVVEKDGFLVNGLVGSVGAKALIRGLTDTTGRPLSIGGNDIDGLKVNYVMNGTWDDENALLLAGDFTKAVYAIRQDITIKRCTEGVIQDENGDIIYNLMQNDMIALRFTMRLGWQVANPVSIMNEDADTRYPFAVLTKNAPTALNAVTFTVTDTASAKVAGVQIAMNDVMRTTSSGGTAVINVPAGFVGSWLATDGNQVKSGTVGPVNSATPVAIDGWAPAAAGASMNSVGKAKVGEAEAE